MKRLAIFTAFLSMQVCADQVEIDGSKFSCVGDPRKITSCSINVGFKELSHAKYIYCYGELEQTVKVKGLDTLTTLNQGFLQSYSYPKEITYSASEKIKLSVNIEIDFNAKFSIQSVREKWLKCESSNVAL